MARQEVNPRVGRIPQRPITFFKISAEGQTVIPREVRKRSKLRAGDTPRYRGADNGTPLDKASDAADNPFSAFFPGSHKYLMEFRINELVEKCS